MFNFENELILNNPATISAALQVVGTKKVVDG